MVTKNNPKQKIPAKCVTCQFTNLSEEKTLPEISLLTRTTPLSGLAPLMKNKLKKKKV